MTIDIKVFRSEAQAFAKEHLAECAAEIIEWQDTAILRDGRVRELAAKCDKFIANHDALRVAESFINRAAVERVASTPPSTEGALEGQAAGERIKASGLADFRAAPAMKEKP